MPPGSHRREADEDMGLQGTIRGTLHRTTVPDRKAPWPLDKVNPVPHSGGVVAELKFKA